MQEIVQSTLDKVRTLSHALHPVILDEIGFEGALDQYLPGFQKQTGIEVHYEKSGAGRELDRGVAIHLYRVMQEALNNIAKHSQSKRAAVRLRYLPESVVLEVEDDGVGFGSSHGVRHGPGFHARARRPGERPVWTWRIAVPAARWSGLPCRPRPQETHA